MARPPVALWVLKRVRFYSTLEVLRLMPLSWAARWVTVSSRVQYWLQPRRRRKTIAWLRAIGVADGSSSDMRRLVQSQFTRNAMREYLTDLLLLHDPRDFSDILEVHGWDRIQTALENGRGVVIMSTHTGMPRLLRWLLRTTNYRTCYMLRLGFPDEHHLTLFGRLARWRRRRYDLDSDDLIGHGDVSIRYMKRAYDHLRQNGVLNIAVDGPRGKRRLPVTVCGQPRTLGGAGFQLALMTGATILPCFTVVEEGPRFYLEIQEPLDEASLRSTSTATAQQAQALATAFARRFEAYVRRHPASVRPRPIRQAR